ncbi:glutamine--tRNA ligase/YqeY domain fusion protein [Thermanaerovibrio velox]|uniref:glutamine--tRNA ligase/YqeY domain fusion protein n=1 Tax=Thermanaerovibrio velox TaxID=108007 RepID=UPI00030D9925|nr:glutamine--tRNA ligase/YqeY domain fusion protein [Thermanaerovibrio velox]
MKGWWTVTDLEKPEKPEKRSPEKGANFLEEIIQRDLDQGVVREVVTRFPPEPNGYLHIGHAKSICLNFGLAEKFGGRCNLRFDDTNPAKEDDEYVRSIEEDVRWLGFKWDRLCFASDYFEQFYQWAVELTSKGLAYVDFQSPEEIRRTRGTLTEPGIESPYRDTPPEENLKLLERMRSGEFEEGQCVLRAKIDMKSPNLNMRDPVIYRILKRSHHRTGDKWCIYPMYDFAHGYEDAIEGVTHSICTLEFQDHRPLYDWFLDNVSVPHRPRQYEFARLNLSHTVMSKRKLLELVESKIVSGWDDPRMPTVSGLRRRGYTPSSIRRFCEEIGVSKADSLVDVELLQHCLREELNKTAPRRMAVLNPIRLTILNWPEDQVDMVPGENNPEDPSAGTRLIPFGRDLLIEAEDFMVDPPKGYFRLQPGGEVRLKHGYLVRYVSHREEDGRVTEVLVEADLQSRGGEAPDGRRVKGTLHWVNARRCVPITARLYDHLFTLRDMSKMEEGKDYKDYLNPNSLVEVKGFGEEALRDAEPLKGIQFLRHGYFCLDPDSSKDHLIFNRSVSLKDSWAKAQKKG